MKALDTNILIRFLTGDNAAQAEIVVNYFKQAELKKELIFVPILVVLETIWVLKSTYKVGREEILGSLAELLLMPILKFESPSAIRGFIAAAYSTNKDLSDLLIAYSAKFCGCEAVLTFDKDAARFELFELIT